MKHQSQQQLKCLLTQGFNGFLRQTLQTVNSKGPKKDLQIWHRVILDNKHSTFELTLKAMNAVTKIKIHQKRKNRKCFMRTQKSVHSGPSTKKINKQSIKHLHSIHLKGEGNGWPLTLKVKSFLWLAGSKDLMTTIKRNASPTFPQSHPRDRGEMGTRADSHNNAPSCNSTQNKIYNLKYL